MKRRELLASDWFRGNVPYVKHKGDVVLSEMTLGSDSASDRRLKIMGRDLSNNTIHGNLLANPYTQLDGFRVRIINTNIDGNFSAPYLKILSEVNELNREELGGVQLWNLDVSGDLDLSNMLCSEVDLACTTVGGDLNLVNMRNSKDHYLDELEGGLVGLSIGNSHIKGDLDLSDLKSHSLHIGYNNHSKEYNTVIEGNANLSGMVISGIPDFDNCDFKGDIDLSGTEFNKINFNSKNTDKRIIEAFVDGEFITKYGTNLFLPEHEGFRIDDGKQRHITERGVYVTHPFDFDGNLYELSPGSIEDILENNFSIEVVEPYILDQRTKLWLGSVDQAITDIVETEQEFKENFPDHTE